MSPEIIQFLEKYPTASKIILGTLKQGTVGATQGAVKGAAEGDAVKGAEGGALGGVVGGALAEGGGAALKAAGKTIGIGGSSFEDAMRAAKPGKWNQQFITDWQTAAPRLAKLLDSEGKFNNLDEAAGRIREAADDIWTQEVQPIIKKYEADAVNTDPIYDGIRNRITPSLQKFNPDSAKVIDDIANHYNPSKVLSVGELEADLEHLNSEIKATGFYSKPTEEQAAMLKTNPQITAWDAAAKGIREQLYSHLSKTPRMETDIEELKDSYGAMSNVAKTVKGQVNVLGRQVPVSMKQAIGLAAGIAHGGPTGAIAAALPILDKLYNDPTTLLNRAISKAGAPGVIRQVGAVAAPIVKSAVKEGASKVGMQHHQAGEPIAEAAPEQSPWTRMALPNNQGHVEVHPEDVSEATKRGLTVVS